MSILEKYKAAFIQSTSKSLEKLVAPYKTELFEGVRGTIVEIGPGTGVNLVYLHEDISWTGVEPNAELQKLIAQQSKRPKNISFVSPNADDTLPFTENSIDHVIDTFVLCSVSNPRKMLDSIYSILKPGGTFRFIEHIAAAPNSPHLLLQNIITPFSRFFAGNCHPNRPTEKWIRQMKFTSIEMKRFDVPMRKTGIVYPCVYGTVIK